MKAPSTRVAIIASAITFALASAGGATAAVLITGAQIADESVTGVDIRNGSLTAADVSGVGHAQFKGTYATAQSEAPVAFESSRRYDSCYGARNANGEWDETGCWNSMPRQVVAKTRINVPFTGRLFGQSTASLKLHSVDANYIKMDGACSLTAMPAGNAGPTGDYNHFLRKTLYASFSFNEVHPKVSGFEYRPERWRQEVNPTLSMEITKPGYYDVYLSCAATQDTGSATTGVKIQGKLDAWAQAN